MLVRLLQSENAAQPIEVTLDGMVTAPFADGKAIISVFALLYNIPPSLA